MKNYKFLTVAALSVMLAGCSSDDEVAQQEPQSLAGTPITVTAGVNSLSTRAGYETGTLTEGSFGLFLTTEGYESETNYNASNLKYTYDTDAWTTTGTLLYQGTATMTYHAYMPYDASATDGSYTFAVKEDQTTADNVKASDFLYAAAATATSANISVNFAHKMSKLKVVLVPKNDLASSIAFTSVTLSNCATSTTIDLSTGTVTSVEAGTGANRSIGHLVGC